MIASDNVILAERPALARRSIVHGLGRTVDQLANQALEAFLNMENGARS